MQIDSNEDAIQYRVFAEHRLHFGRLFFQVVAFGIILVLAEAAVATQWPATSVSIIVIGAGVTLLATGFIAYRVYRQEEAYAHLLQTIETRTPNWIVGPEASRPSSRMLVAAGLAVLGLAVMVLGLWAV